MNAVETEEGMLEALQDGVGDECKCLSLFKSGEPLDPLEADPVETTYAVRTLRSLVSFASSFLIGCFAPVRSVSSTYFVFALLRFLFFPSQLPFLFSLVPFSSSLLLTCLGGAVRPSFTLFAHTLAFKPRKMLLHDSSPPRLLTFSLVSSRFAPPDPVAACDINLQTWRDRCGWSFMMSRHRPLGETVSIFFCVFGKDFFQADDE